MKKICVGIVGANYGAFLHLNGYPKVYGVELRLKTIVDIAEERAKSAAEKHGFEQYSTDFEDILQDPEIEVIDICTPPFLHGDMIKKAIAAGKHVLCEKPLTGYFGKEGDSKPIGTMVSKQKMYKDLMAEMNSIREVISSSDRKFMYCENYIYAPSVMQAVEIMKNRKSKLLYMVAEESINGSSSAVASEWSTTGGGVLIRGGIHALTGVLWMKMKSSEFRGEEFKVVSVSADMGQISKSLTEEEHQTIRCHPNDVEDFATVTITFSDGTKALVITSDTSLGGSKNYVDCYFNDTILKCKMSMTDLLTTFSTDERGLEDIRYSDRPECQKFGWNYPLVSDAMIRGYTLELQDFFESVADENRKPQSSFDVAYLTMQVVYAAYVSAEEKRCVELDTLGTD
jgi:predicted dehydrogenase